MALLTLALAVGSADAAKQRSRVVVRSKQKVVVCHATGNGGYVSVNVAVDNIITGQGHGSHPNDIIPPFEYELSNGETGSYPGHNWGAAGEAIWSNGCVRPPPPAGRVNVHVACVDVHANGTYDAQFGYVSSVVGSVTIPVSSGTPPNNYFSSSPPGPVDRGQVTTFVRGTVLHAFTVSGATNASLTWNVSYGGHTSSATATAAFGIACEDPPSTEPDVPIGVFVTCVVNHPSTSTYDAVFGYETANADAETIPVGDANNFDPAPEDRGQPTMFSPGTVTNAVTVTGISDSVALTWTVAWTTTNKAIASADFQNKCSQPANLPIIVPRPPTNQPIGIFAECVTNAGSTYDATFGYVNENGASVTVPIGPRNSVSPGPADQGQPDTFVPGFVARAFTVHGIGNSTTETWRVIVGGEARVATATASFPTQCVTDPTVPVDGAGIEKSVTPNTVMVGQQVRFTLRAFNDGSLVLRYFDAKDNMAGHGLRALSVRSTLGRCRARRLSRSSQVVCSTGTLAPGQAMTIHVVAQATSPGTWDDTATVPTTPTGPPPPGAPPAPTVPAPALDRTPKDNVDAAHVTVISSAPPAVTG
jgi:hypothetical protein